MPKPKGAYFHKKTYNDNGEKWCSGCKDYHPIHMFGKNKFSNDGKHWKCCESTRVKLRTPVSSKSVMSNIFLVSQLNTPKLESQVLYEYKRPDSYDLYIQSLPKRTQIKL